MKEPTGVGRRPDGEDWFFVLMENGAEFTFAIDAYPEAAALEAAGAPRCPKCDAYLLTSGPFAGCARCGWLGVSE